MKGPHNRPVVIVPPLGRHRDKQSAVVVVHRSHVFRWKEIRGGDASLYTLYELEDEERPMEEDEEEYEDHDGVEYAYDDDDEYEYYEVDHDESTEGTRDSRVMSLSKRMNIAMPMQAISSKLVTMHQRLMTNNNIPSISLGPITKFLSLPPHLVSSSAVVVIGTTTLSLLSLWILRTMMLHKSWRVDKIMFRNGRKRLVGGGGGRKNGRKDRKKKQNNNNNKNEKKYGDYSTGYPMENGDEGEEVVDLDVKSVGKRERVSYWNSLKQNALIPFNTATYWMESVKLYMTSRVEKMGSWSIGNALLFFSKTKKRLDAKAGTIGNGNVDNNFESMAENNGARQSPASTEAEVKDTTRTLQHQLDALAEEHESLEQEYEASLRMLHEARIELRQLKSKRANGNNDDRDDAQEENQKQIMDSTIQKLEQKYKQQMKEQMERFRTQTEQKLRMELTQEYESALQSQSEQMAQELQQQKEEYLSSPSFQQLVNEASSIQIQEAVAQAVQDTIRQQQLQSREEMMRVREAIQKVLERERRMMKEQVAKATSQVREWVKRQQVEQLQRREEQLVVEARELGLLEEEEEVGVEEEEGGMVGDSFVSSRRDRDGRYVAGSSFRDERRRWEARDGSMGREENSVEEIPYRGDYYSDQSNEYNEYKDENGEDDGTAGEMGQDLPNPRAQSPRRGQPRNVYREAAKRKQRRREEGL